jgi:hypothetical protein
MLQSGPVRDNVLIPRGYLHSRRQEFAVRIIEGDRKTI